jgi:hypothetical protein
MIRLSLMTTLFIMSVGCSQVLEVGDVTSGSDGGVRYEGTHYGYVVSKVSVPVAQSQIRQYGLDLGNASSSSLDGTIDNAFGATLSFLAALNLPIQQTITNAIDRGTVIQLIDFQTNDFMNANSAGFRIRLGQTPAPAACNGPTDTICRHHLAGTGAFSVALDSPTDAIFGGDVAGGTFSGGPNDITLQIAYGSTTLINLKLVHARITASSISMAGIVTANVGGLVTKAELTAVVVPVIQAQFRSIVNRDCGSNGLPPNCGCRFGSTGDYLMKALDGDLTNGLDRDCQFSSAELLVFAPLDSCSKDICASADSLSVGLQIEAVKATFPM